jgi:hypothetical protein
MPLLPAFFTEIANDEKDADRLAAPEHAAGASSDNAL